MRFILIGLFLINFSLLAQDPVFSQYYATPLSINPALAGSFIGTYRVGGIHRNAWNWVGEVPIATYAFNGEYRFNFGKNVNFPDFGAAGLRFFSDRTSILEQNTNSISGTFAYHKSLSKFKNKYLSLGLEFGLEQRNINYGNLNFEDEYDQIGGFVEGTSELLPANNIAYADFAVGVNYWQDINKKNKIYTGVSLKHLSTPNISFWKNSTTENPNLKKNDKLHLLSTIHLSTDNQLNHRISITPRIIVQLQGNNFQLLGGSILRYNLLSRLQNQSAIHMGAMMRIGSSEEGLQIVHAIPFFGYEINHFLVGVSYDINLFDFENNPRGIGALEISLSYTGEVNEDSAFCPKF